MRTTVLRFLTFVAAVSWVEPLAAIGPFTFASMVGETKELRYGYSGAGTRMKASANWLSAVVDATCQISASGTCLVYSYPEYTIWVNPAGLQPGLYRAKLSMDGSSALDQTVTLYVWSHPTIQSIANAADGTVTTLGSNEWISIYGNFGVGMARSWDAKDMRVQPWGTTELPTELCAIQLPDGSISRSSSDLSKSWIGGCASVTIRGKPVPISYMDDHQVNVLVPKLEPLGKSTVEVRVARAKMSMSGSTVMSDSARSLYLYGASSIELGESAPALFREGKFAIAQDEGGNLITTEHPAVAGHVIAVYGTGFGETSPSWRAEEAVPCPAPLIAPVKATIGGHDTGIEYAGLIQSGLYQINIRLPEGVPSGNHMLAVNVGGVQAPELLLPVRAH